MKSKPRPKAPKGKSNSLESPSPPPARKHVNDLLQSLPEFKLPSYSETLHFPASVLDLETGNVSDLIGKFTMMLAHVNAEHAKANVAMLRAQGQESARKRQLVQQYADKAEKWRRDAAVEIDPKLVALKEELIEKQAVREILASYVFNYDKIISALSRELTRRTHQK